MKKRNLIITIIVVCVILFFLSHSTYWKYNDWWIIGRHYTEVEDFYGEFDRDLGNKKGYFIKEDDSMIMPSYRGTYYWMIHNEEGIITEVFVKELPGG